jgi:hypothetical protein
MTVLSNKFCEGAGIPLNTDLPAFITFLRNSTGDLLDGILTSEEGMDAAEASLAQLPSYTLRIVRQQGIIQEKYCRVHFAGTPTPVLVALLGDCAAESYPTDMENLLLWAFAQPDSPLSADWQSSNSGPVLGWRKLARGLAVIAEPIPIVADVARSIAALFGLEHRDLVVSMIPPPIVAAASNIHFGSPSDALGLVPSRLFFEAVGSGHPKWRFLSFYRILENSYLNNIKKVLLDEFDRDAGRAVEEAKKKLQAEVNQLIDLVTANALAPEFHDFNREFDTLIARGNNFLISIDRAAQNEQLYRADVLKKAVVRFYKLRCSIAHAGTSSVIYEQTPDANVAMLELLPSVESIVLKSLRISALP